MLRFTKRVLAVMLAMILLFAFTACGKEEAEDSGSEAFYGSVDEVTFEKLTSKSMPDKILSSVGGIELKYRDENVDDEGEFASWITFRYVLSDDIVQVNQFVDYDNGDYTHMYFSNDEEDAFVYTDTQDANQVVELSAEDFAAMYGESLFGLEYFEGEINSCAEQDGSYLVNVTGTMTGSEQVTQEFDFTVNPTTGLIEAAVVDFYYDGELSGTVTYSVTYGTSVKIDTTPKEGGSAAAEAEAEEAPTDSEGADLVFEAEDMDGNTYTQDNFAAADVIMLNFWEPWCGPCINEMPELQKLYETYQSQGLIIIGAFSTSDMDDSAKAVLEKNGITYPILRCEGGLEAFETEYVPTTVFFDGEGNLLSEEPQIGALSYEEWEELLLTYLK